MIEAGRCPVDPGRPKLSTFCEEATKASTRRQEAVREWHVENPNADRKPGRSDLPSVATEVVIRRAHDRCRHLTSAYVCNCLCHGGG